MHYDFDTIVPRKGTGCIKYDGAKENGLPEDILPLWVADMDFRTAPEILSRMKDSVSHGIFGYADPGDGYDKAVIRWYEERFDWRIEKEWLVRTPGVVFALSAAVRAFTKEGESVLIERPVYYPFSDVILSGNRKLVNSPLLYKNGHYEIDFEDFEEKITENAVRLFLLCSPHNPVGRVWKEWELKKMADICIKHDVIIISDEIHSDFVYPGNKHTVLATLSAEVADRAVICTAPSKTFNLAGLQISNIVISNPVLRKKFVKAVHSIGYLECNIFGLVSCQAAYEEGGPWLDELKQYLWENYLYVKEYIETRMPRIKLLKPEGTYLLWMDFGALGLSTEELESFITKKAGLWLDGGTMFGEEGKGFQRLNMACPRATLKQAMERLEKAYTSYTS